MKPNLDKLDLQIIQNMLLDNNISYAELGKKLFVSGGTIHVRIKKMEREGIVKGSKINIDFSALGFDVTAFIGIYLKESSLYDKAATQLKTIPEIVRLNYTTGNYSMFAEIRCRDIHQLRDVLHEKLQRVEGIERTETIISLDESFNRDVVVDEG